MITRLSRKVLRRRFVNIMIGWTLRLVFLMMVRFLLVATCRLIIRRVASRRRARLLPTLRMVLRFRTPIKMLLVNRGTILTRFILRVGLALVVGLVVMMRRLVTRRFMLVCWLVVFLLLFRRRLMMLRVMLLNWLLRFVYFPWVVVWLLFSRALVRLRLKVLMFRLGFVPNPRSGLFSWKIILCLLRILVTRLRFMLL